MTGGGLMCGSQGKAQCLSSAEREELRRPRRVTEFRGGA